MITGDWVRMMARYNAWQTGQLLDGLDGMSEADLRADRGAFFGSILGTLNHLLWGDGMWMARFDGGPAPAGRIADSTGLHPGLDGWRAARLSMDGRIIDWATGLQDGDLAGALTWFSGATGREVSKPLAECVTHMFNHQTHHRGQVHAMLTAAGAKAPVSDLVFMPEEV